MTKGIDWSDYYVLHGKDKTAEEITIKLQEALAIDMEVSSHAFNVPALPGLDCRDGTGITRPLSELGNAQRLLDSHVGNIYYVFDAKNWLIWDGSHWLWDMDGAAVRNLAAKLPQQIYDEGRHFINQADFFAKWSRVSQRSRTIEAAVSLLRDFEEVRLPFSLVDSDPMMVGIDSAKHVLDLTNGTTRPAKQADFVTKSLNVDHLGDPAKAVRWLEFLDQVFGDDVDLIDWLHRWCGYVLTGSMSEQFFLFCFGLGANGKSVFADVLRSIVGDYARAIASETISESRRQAGNATPDLAALIGARLVVSSETEDGAALAESLVKSLVAGDTLSVRKLYADEIQFRPQFKLIVLGNHKPIIRGVDYGIWRRVRLIPFKRVFKPEERDPKLVEKLILEREDVLAWMLKGCLEWQKRGLGDTPSTIRSATGEYQQEQDLIGQWVSECCKESTLSEESATDLYISYKAWCVNNGLKPASNVALGRKLAERGYGSRQSNGKRLWRGLCVAIPDYNDSYQRDS